jgi:hypothetical protein
MFTPDLAQDSSSMKVTSPFLWPMDSNYLRPLPLTWTPEYAFAAAMLEVLNILAVEQDYGIELTAADFDNFDFLVTTFANAAKFQEILYEIILERIIGQVTTTIAHNRHNLRMRSYVVARSIIAMRKCIPDVEVDQFSPKQRRLYIFYGQGQLQPPHHTHMAQLVIINFYIRHCKQNSIPVGDSAEFDEFMVHYYQARTFPTIQPISSDLAPGTWHHNSYFRHSIGECCSTIWS